MAAVYIWQCCAVMYYLAALQGFFVFEMRCCSAAHRRCLFRAGNDRPLALFLHGREHEESGLLHMCVWDGSFMHSHGAVVLSLRLPSPFSAHLVGKVSPGSDVTQSPLSNWFCNYIFLLG